MGQNISRRDFSKLLFTGAAGSALGIGAFPLRAGAAASKRVVVVGGGFGGASAAKYLKKLDSSISVTLIEPKAVFYTCPFSNWVIGGLKTMQEIAQKYAVLKNRYKVDVLADTVVSVDGVKSTVKLKSGKVVGYDRLIVSPGIDFDFEAIEGYSRKVAESVMPHAYEAGPQTVLLQKQLHSLKDGGKVIICPPANPFRCPPGPYERASLIAHYLKENKPKSRILILDAKEKFSKQALFTKGWERLYPGMIEWRSASTGGRILNVDSSAMRVTTEFGIEKGDVINLIPPQKAGKIAFDAGLVDSSGWCPVNPVSFESLIQPGIHVIGDACTAGAMPKSGFAASSQGKVTAAAIARLFRGEVPVAPSLVNTCYSLIGPGYGISVAAVYKLTADGIVSIKGAGGLTPMDADDDQLSEEATFARGWYNNIAQDIWG
ncbi:cytochrome C [Chlorobium phaeovibrioides]|uniref:Cytochrome C n=1 Tax=Chlorobium phaeovibrioides TaxID=1094 RepID=A0A432AUD2_CHLPH|nr:NAD(P)/FAD-dependent oxidoreductase [Chlorobium phaeovibrioides]RTY38130.1 cytochrome C [Chlorobium phaeovibrioides]